MIKDNHIALGRGITACVEKARKDSPLLTQIEVETKNLEEVQEAIEAQADVIMLDNMSLEQMEEAISLIRQTAPSIQVEVSGNVTAERLHELGQLDVDFISSGALTHSARAMDISLNLVPSG